MRTIPALLVTVGLLASLTACASGSASASGCDAAGTASEAVTATGPIGTKPKISVPAGLTTATTEVSVLKQGDGATVSDGSPVVIAYSVVDGATGKVAQTSGYSKTASAITVGSTNAGEIGKALECARVGDRVAIVTTKKALSSGKVTGSGQQDAAVVVADVLAGYMPRANGRPQVAADGMPAVVLAPNGAPGITIPTSEAAPKTDQTHLLRKGSGAELTTKDTALVKYTAVTWTADPSVAGSSWTDGSGAVTVPLAEDGTVAAQIRDALVGTHVGDQVLAILTQSGTTYAYVFDVLGTLPR